MRTPKQGLSQQGLADRIGCARQNVTRAIRDGQLVKNAAGRIDADHPSNVEWIASRRGMRDAAAPACTSTGALPVGSGPDRAELERAKLAEQIAMMKQKRDAARGLLISTDMTTRVFAKIFAINQSEFVPLAGKMAVEAAAICGADSDENVRAIREYGETECWKIIAHCKRLINDFFDSIEAEPLD
jgi:hypothetical protein